MPLPPGVAPPAASEHWICLGCLLQVRVQLYTDLSKVCECASVRCASVRPEEIDNLFRPSLPL